LMAQTFIGRIISLTSSSDIRYRGILEGIDQSNSTITLRNVYQLGTEDRRPINSPEYIAPSPDPYETIVFRALNVKDISVDDQPPPQQQRAPPNDPAVLSSTHTSTYQQQYPPVPSSYPMHPPAPGQAAAYGQAQMHMQTQQNQPPRHQRRSPPLNNNSRGQAKGSRQQNANGSQSANPVRTAEVSLESVGRALNNLRVSNDNDRQSNGRGGRDREIKAGEIRFPNSDFDFEQSNARFDKSALASMASEEVVEEKTESADAEAPPKLKKKEETKDKAYNPTKSFFDSLSTSAPPPQQGVPRGGGRRGGGRGGGRARSRREEEREKNMTTFGEPGGVGLMGAGNYVPGWGGGGNPRRGRGGGGGGGRR